MANVRKYYSIEHHLGGTVRRSVARAGWTRAWPGSNRLPRRVSMTKLEGAPQLWPFREGSVPFRKA